jgi:hypothetical protein
MSEKLECKRCQEIFETAEAPVGKCPNCNGTLKYLSNSETSKKSAKAGKKSEESDADSRRSYWNPEAKEDSTSWSPDVVKKRISQNSGTSKSISMSAKEATLDDLVAAQNRTTYAVRSLAVFFFITLCTSPFGYALVGAGVDAASSTMVAWGWIIIVTGFLTGLLAGMLNLSLSRPR